MRRRVSPERRREIAMEGVRARLSARLAEDAALKPGPRDPYKNKDLKIQTEPLPTIQELANPCFGHHILREKQCHIKQLASKMRRMASDIPDCIPEA